MTGARDAGLRRARFIARERVETNVKARLTDSYL